MQICTEFGVTERIGPIGLDVFGSGTNPFEKNMFTKLHAMQNGRFDINLDGGIDPRLLGERR